MSKNIPKHEAWERAARFLTLCSGFPEGSKYKLYKQSQTYIQPLNQHKLVFTLLVDHPSNIPAGEALTTEKAVEPIGPYYAEKPAKEGQPFQLLRDLIEIIELQAEEKRLKTGKAPFSRKK